MIVLSWLGFSVIVGVAANTRGRSGIGWLFLSLLISPLLSGLLLVALPKLNLEPQLGIGEWKDRRPCPFCAEPIRREAKVCKHCHREVPVTSGERTAPAAEAHVRMRYPDVHKGVRYRCEPDGSVTLATSVGPKRFKSWGEFWREVN